MRSVRSALVGLGTLIVLVTFVGFATFSADVPGGSRPEIPPAEPPQPLVLAADAGAATGRVTAFVFANQLQAPTPPTSTDVAGVEAIEVVEFLEIDELTLALMAEQGRTRPSPGTTTGEPSTTTTTGHRYHHPTDHHNHHPTDHHDDHGIDHNHDEAAGYDHHDRTHHHHNGRTHHHYNGTPVHHYHDRPPVERPAQRRRNASIGLAVFPGRGTGQGGTGGALRVWLRPGRLQPARTVRRALSAFVHLLGLPGGVSRLGRSQHL